MQYLCRICLSDKAEYNIFGNDESSRDISSKISKCLNAKLEDIEGHPSKICHECNDMLYYVSEFIDKFNQTCEILSNGIILKTEDIKTENPTYDSDSDDKNEYLFNFENSVDQTEDCVFETLTQNDELTRQIQTNHKNKKGCNKRLNYKSVKIKKSTLYKKPPRIKEEKDKILNTPKNSSRLCHECGEVFKSNESLKCHTKRVHEKIKFTCNLCHKTYNSSSGRNRHFREKHSKTAKRYFCSKCDKAYSDKRKLSEHIQRDHDNIIVIKEKKYGCKLCKKRFFGPKWLLIHERSAHTGERPAVCSVCKADFFHEDYLKEHMRLHTGEAPFKCLVCGKGHAQRGNMKSHLRVHRLSELDPDVIKTLNPNIFKYFKK